LLKLDKVAKKIVTGREKPQFVFHGKLIDHIRPTSAFQVHKKSHAKKSEDGHTSEADVHGR